MAYDLKITDAVIVDGTGSPRYSGDIGVSAGKVVALGHAPDAASRTVNARGQVAAPGFVDIHTHYDAQLMWDPLLTVSPWHGVTTVVMGNCGFTLAPTRVAHRHLVMRTFERVEGMSDSALEQGPGQDWGFVSYPEYLDAVDRYGTGIIRDRGASRLPPRAAGRDGYIAKPIRCKALLAEVARLTGSATP